MGSKVSRDVDLRLTWRSVTAVCVQTGGEHGDDAQRESAETKVQHIHEHCSAGV